MSKQAQRPDPDRIMSSLKDFQRATVELVFERMYTAENPARRFLVADEVGLGKTLVARGVIARAVDHLWDKIERLDVIYICSNHDIARQNINRLDLRTDADVALASRMTMLPVTLPNLQRNKLNFIAFTPGTSFNLRSAGGKAEERILLYHLLHDAWALGDRKGPVKALQGGVHDTDDFHRRIREYERADRIDADLKARFLTALEGEANETIGTGKASLRGRFLALARRLEPLDAQRLSKAQLRQRREIVGALRELLAKVCVHALEPDIIVMDEFQRFRSLLEDDDPMAELARQLFDHRDPDADLGARVLLLSATPYRMYTRHHESDEDHFSDFLATVDFLMGHDPEALEDFKAQLDEYRRALFHLRPETREALREAKDAVESTLGSIMVRNERLQARGSVNAMVREVPADDVRLTAVDLSAYIGTHRLVNAIDAHDHLEYWKSAPYLPNFMDHYVLGRNLVRTLETSGGRERVAAAIRDYPEALLSWSEVKKYAAIDSANAKLRTLVEGAAQDGAWRLLWLPPAMPYYAPGGVFADETARDITKTLVFSAWKMVPRAIATLLSYDAERRMLGAFTDDTTYPDLTRDRRPIIRFQVSKRTTASGEETEDLTGMSFLPLLYPSLTLATAVDPMSLASDVEGESNGHVGGPSAASILRRAAQRVGKLLEDVVPADAYDRPGNEDYAWYWASLAMLDRRHPSGAPRQWLDRPAHDPHAWTSMVRGGDEDDTHFAKHVAAFREYFPDGPALGRAPSDLVERVALMAVASPAVCTLRALLRQWPNAGEGALHALLPAAARAAMGFRSLFNIPEAIPLVRRLTSGDGADPSYWESVLWYGLDGNLQAVMDEYVHILRSALGYLDRPAEEAADEIGETIESAAALRSNQLRFHSLDVHASSLAAMRPAHRMRCRYAMGYGLQVERVEGEDFSRDDLVRTAFNSPFRPFVLATTSIGQEGLDFHWYCHRLVHWNLPSNPVDLEQREGRVNRYKGHAIRRNIAERHATTAIAEALRGSGDVADDPWRHAFHTARYRPDRAASATELDPYWIYEEGSARVERRVPRLPLSRDGVLLQRLRGNLVTYRLVFGQPRQEDLVDFLTRIGDVEEGFLEDVLRECRIDLSAIGRAPVVDASSN